MWVSCVNEHNCYHFRQCVTCSRLNKSVNGGARSKPRDHPQHHQHMLNCPPHAIPPAMHCYGVVAGARTLAVLDLLLWELHLSRGVIGMLSAHLARSTPQWPTWGGNARHAWYDGVLARSHAIVFSSAAGGAHWPIAIHCPSLPFSSVKVHQAGVLVRRFRFSMVAGYVDQNIKDPYGNTLHLHEVMFMLMAECFHRTCG